MLSGASPAFRSLRESRPVSIVDVLEQAGLVATEKVRRVRNCRRGQGALDEEWSWLERYRRMWTARFDAPGKVVEELKRKETDDGRKQ